jgi:Lrp/AsnC family transcriptional regulator
MKPSDRGPPDLDETDLRLLDLLQKDSSLSTAQLAEAINLSTSPCWRRINRLQQEGYIRRQVTLLDPEKLGFTTTVFATVRLSAHGRANLNDFSEAIGRFPEVMECYATLGASDFVLKIVTRDIKAYEAFFFGQLSTLPAIQEIHSTIALSEVKSTTELPIRRR